MSIQDEIDAIDQQIENLYNRRRELKYMQFMGRFNPSTKVWLLCNFIRQNPGCDKKKLLEYESNVTELNNLLMQARRNWRLIENRGSRSRPRWYIRSNDA